MPLDECIGSTENFEFSLFLRSWPSFGAVARLGAAPIKVRHFVSYLSYLEQDCCDNLLSMPMHIDALNISSPPRPLPLTSVTSSTSAVFTAPGTSSLIRNTPGPPRIGITCSDARSESIPTISRCYNTPHLMRLRRSPNRPLSSPSPHQDQPEPRRSPSRAIKTATAIPDLRRPLQKQSKAKSDTADLSVGWQTQIRPRRCLN